MVKEIQLLTTYEAMNILRITRKHLYRLMKSGKIKAIDIGMGNKRADWRIKATELTKFLNKKPDDIQGFQEPETTGGAEE